MANRTTGWTAGFVALAVAVTAEAVPTNLAMTHYYQGVSSYTRRFYCGPATGQMITKYLTGKYISQTSFARVMGTSAYGGTGAYGVSRGIRYYSGFGYYTVSGFNRTRVVANINRYRPVHANFNCRYLAYRGYRASAHHSPIKGYTSGGYYIHDSSVGPNKWASRTQMWNAVVYHRNLYSVRY